MNQLETLLNTLIARGWKPWGIKADFSEYKFGKFRFIKMSGEIVRMCTLRELVSLESGLWQFCEKNGLLREYYNGRSSIHPYKCYWTTTYEYRLLESALVPEEELAQFLIENIQTE